jgi:hypothetical protein
MPADFSVLASGSLVVDVNKPINTNATCTQTVTSLPKITRITEVVAENTHDGTLRPNLDPEPTTGDHFEPLSCLKFPPCQTLPPEVESGNPFGIWSFLFLRVKLCK